VVKAGARVGPYTVLGSNCQVEEGADIAGAIVWPSSIIGREARLVDTIVGRSGDIGPHASLRGGVLGDNTHITEHSRL
jgi:NDP-sugar pyrophosphorylase family protein